MTSDAFPTSDPVLPEPTAVGRAGLRERVARLQSDRTTAVPAQHLSPAPSRIRLSGLG